jgi:transcriptional regulator with XRE-family HTH domain
MHEMLSSVTGREIKRLRKEAGLSQASLAEGLGVSQALFSRWERSLGQPSRRQEAQLKVLLAESEKAEGSASNPGQDYGEWLRTARDRKGFSRKDLAALSGVSSIQIYNIETGRTTNPRDTTRASLEQSLGDSPPNQLVEAVEQSAEIAGVGSLSDFDPHTEDEFPKEPGVYVLYDISDRPIYVGKSQQIRRRLREHADKFWYRSPIVEKAAYVRVEDATLRNQMEETLIKFLKSNAVINQQLTDR